MSEEPNGRAMTSAAVRLRVYKRDRFRCTYCGIPGTDAELEVDHIVAVSKGGSNHMSNLTTACRSCNQSKGDREWEPQQLEGAFFLTFEDGRVKRQGQALRSLASRTLVQWYEWAFGEPTNKEWVRDSDLETAQFFVTAAAWNRAADRECQRLMSEPLPPRGRR